MVSNINNEVITNYIGQPSQPNKNKLIEFLWAEIINALKGIKGCNRYERSYKFYYKVLPNYEKNNLLPDEVELFGIKKDFNDALEKLIKDFIKKITNHKINSKTIVALTKDETDRKKWIISTLGLTLNNKIFKKEIADDERKKSAVKAIIKKLFFTNKTANFSSIEEIKNIIKNNSNVFNADAQKKLFDDFDNQKIACWALSFTPFSDQDAIEWVNKNNLNNNIDEKLFKKYCKSVETSIMRYLKENIADTEKKESIDIAVRNNEDNYNLNPLDKEAFEEYLRDTYKEMADSGIDVIKWQKDAFFWKPKSLFRDIELTGNEGKRAMYIAFFYAWLRRCSFATFQEIAKEASVKKASTVSRDWKPHHALAEPFPKAHDVFCPVYFSKKARSLLGMFNSNIRCYQKNNYENEEYKKNILTRKNILWKIYTDFLKQDDSIDEIETNYNKNPEKIFTRDNFKISYDYISNDDLNLHPKKRYFLMHIKNIQKMENDKDENPTE